jgi:hypothetical protein
MHISSFSPIGISNYGSEVPHSSHSSNQKVQEEWMREPIKYEPNLTPMEFESHVQNRQRVDSAIRNCIESLPSSLGAVGIRSAIEENMASILKEAKFDPDIYPLPKEYPREKGDEKGVNAYSKFLLAKSDGASKAPYCMQIFVFADNQKTPIHDHPVECTSLCVKGSPLHRSYVIGENGKPEKQKELSITREVWEAAKVFPDKPNIHSIKAKQGPVVTVHFYYMDGVSDSKDGFDQTRAVKTNFGNSSTAKKMSLLFGDRSSTASPSLSSPTRD